jgi:hypothetical protein
MILPSARETADLVASALAGNTAALLEVVMLTGLMSGVGSTAGSGSFSVSGYGGKDVLKLIQDLRNKGYYVTQSSTTVTIYWDGTINTSQISY